MGIFNEKIYIGCNMTHEFYKNKLNNIQIQIEHLQEEKRQLHFEYIEERRMIDTETDVISKGNKYWFTGDCEIDEYGNLLYRLERKNGISIYKLFEEFEVVNE